MPGTGAVPDRARTMYCDASVIMAVMMGPSDPYFGDTMGFLDAAERTGTKLLVSGLTLMECVELIRRRVKSSFVRRDGSKRERGEAEAAAAAAVDRFVRFVDGQLARRNMQALRDMSMPSFDLDLLLRAHQVQGRG